MNGFPEFSEAHYYVCYLLAYDLGEQEGIELIWKTEWSH